ncbi:MAG TPA: endonuclease/exonuclease/phosphatase family protein [Solirubrobacteraceae bacterium]|nr:endonuclease/exonuclease/phosphatase family protein [Solirubrobacteraceae bacterium]
MAVGFALVVAVAGRGGPSASAVPMAHGSSTYTLMQMNLCLSGYAGCYGKVAYPAGVQAAVARIRDALPDAVTLNETCRADVGQIARQTGYHLRFSTVTVAGEPLRCTRPGGRGFFGDAVLTKAAIESTESHDFAAQAGIEWRRWLCVRTRVDVCTAHLATEAGANAAQCAELTAILARRAAMHTVIFGGDVNRRSACVRKRAWTRTDGSADQAPGLQAIYGTGALRSPTAQVIPARHTDHDILQVRARYRVTRKRPTTPAWVPKPTQ